MSSETIKARWVPVSEWLPTRQMEVLSTVEISDSENETLRVVFYPESHGSPSEFVFSAGDDWVTFTAPDFRPSEDNLHGQPHGIKRVTAWMAMPAPHQR